MGSLCRRDCRATRGKHAEYCDHADNKVRYSLRWLARTAFGHGGKSQRQQAAQALALLAEHEGRPPPCGSGLHDTGVGSSAVRVSRRASGDVKGYMNRRNGYVRRSSVGIRLMIQASVWA